jgi:alpha-1,3-mannosyltransferase
MWNKPWRIVHLCRVAPPGVGGMEAMLGGMARRQLAEGLNVRIVTLGTRTRVRRWEGVEVVELPRIGPSRYPLAWGLGEQLAGADLVHVHGIDGLADQALSLRQAARIGVSTHGGYLHTDRDALLKAVWLRTITRWSLGRADAIWFTSERDAAVLAPAGLAGEVVPDGVELGRFAGVPRAPETGRWLVFGRIDLHKGHADLLRTVAALREIDPRPVRVDVVGACADEGLMGSLIALQRQLGLHRVVRWHGRLPDAEVRALVARCQWAVCPSHAEGFGLAVAELMAAGVAVVASPIAAHVALLGASGAAGDLVDLREPGEAARQLSAMRGVERHLKELEAVERSRRWRWEAVWPAWRAAYARLGVT